METKAETEEKITAEAPGGGQQGQTTEAESAVLGWRGYQAIDATVAV